MAFSQNKKGTAKVVSLNTNPKEEKIAWEMRWAETLSSIGDKFKAETTGDMGVMLYEWKVNHYEYWSFNDHIQKALQFLRSQNPGKANYSFAKSCADTAMYHLAGLNPLPKINARRNIIPLLNVYLEVMPDGRILTHNPESSFGMTYSIQINLPFQGKTHTPGELPQDCEFQKFLDRFQPEREVQAFIQEQCGATLLNRNYGVASWWTGHANSGKTTMMKLTSLFHKKIASIDLHNLKKGEMLEPIMGASLLVCDEVDEKSRWDQEVFKVIVTGGPLTFNRKWKTPISAYENKAKVIICSNELPRVHDASDGVWRRIAPVRFKYPVNDGKVIDNYHTELFEKEGNLILDWMLQGASRIIQRGRFLERDKWPSQVKETYEQSKDTSDHLRLWIKEAQVQIINPSLNDSISIIFADSKKSIYNRYFKWCEESDEYEALHNTAFWRAMKQFFPDFKEKRDRSTDLKRICNLTIGHTI